MIKRKEPLLYEFGDGTCNVFLINGYDGDWVEYLLRLISRFCMHYHKHDDMPEIACNQCISINFHPFGVTYNKHSATEPEIVTVWCHQLRRPLASNLLPNYLGKWNVIHALWIGKTMAWGDIKQPWYFLEDISFKHKHTIGIALYNRQVC